MPTQCNAEQLQFSCVERRRVVAAFDGGTVRALTTQIIHETYMRRMGTVIAWSTRSFWARKKQLGFAGACGTL
jgi:hypothetical protein